MVVFVTSDTHFGHPLVSALRGFITVPNIKAEYDRIAAEEGKAAATQYVKKTVEADSSLSMRGIADTDAHDAAVIDSINAVIDASVDATRSGSNVVSPGFDAARSGSDITGSSSDVTGSSSASARIGSDAARSVDSSVSGDSLASRGSVTSAGSVVSGNSAHTSDGVDLWILGDVGYRTSMEHIRHCLHALHATRLHLVIGNHDVNFHHRERDSEWHHAFATIQDHACITIGGVEYNLSHFPYREDLNPATERKAVPSADGSDNAYDSAFSADALPRDGRRLLFGHTHQHTKAGRHADSLHVGLDSWDLRPVSESQIMAWFA